MYMYYTILHLKIFFKTIVLIIVLIYVIIFNVKCILIIVIFILNENVFTNGDIILVDIKIEIAITIETIA